MRITIMSNITIIGQSTLADQFEWEGQQPFDLSGVVRRTNDGRSFLGWRDQDSNSTFRSRRKDVR